MDKTRTYLCPDCDGWGLTGGERLDVDDYAPEYSCGTCDETGVITATYADGEKFDLHPWAGDTGRAAHRVRSSDRDALERMASHRERAAQVVRQGGNLAFTEYGWIRQNFAMRRTLGWAKYRLNEVAIGLGVAGEQLRRAAA